MGASAPLRPPAAIGFVGLGNMGAPMARRLALAGYRLFVADKNEAAVRAFLAGHSGEISAPATFAELARSVDAVITVLPDGKIVREVLLGNGGVAESLKAGSIVIDMSSSDPIGTRDLGAQLAERGIHLIDAPVSGGVKRAEDGSLSTMVGGDAEMIARVREPLEAMAKQIFLTGALGSGHAMKALNNLVSAAGLWIAAEALLIGKQFGLAPEVMVDVLNASTGRNNSTENKFKQQILSRGFASGFSLGLMAKDLRTANDLAVGTGSFAPFTQECAKLWNDAAGKLGDSADHTAVVQILERAIGQKLTT
jgi:3-hydroxyisobutyrate dehydrogenase